MINPNELLSNGILGKRIDGFPYPVRECKWCGNQMDLEKTVHVQNDPLHFKAIYVCKALNCPMFHPEEKDAFVLVYYSSDPAYKILQGYKLSV